MDPLEESILAVADITLEAEAINRAVLDRDFDEARFRTGVMVERAKALGFDHVAAAATNVLERLGPFGALPNKGYAEAVWKLAGAVDVSWFD